MYGPSREKIKSVYEIPRDSYEEGWREKTVKKLAMKLSDNRSEDS